MTTVSQARPTLDAIKEAVSARYAWGLKALQRLIAVDIIAPKERACQEALAEILRAESLPVQLVSLNEGNLPSVEGFIDTGLPLADRPNLVVALEGTHAGGRSLILNSHIDTVAWQGGAEKWQAHPLSGAVRDGKIYGRGAVDAKGQVMAAVMAVLALRDLGYEPAGRLVVQSVVGEEPDGNGTLALCAQGWLAEAAIVLEPTDNQIAYGHRGVIDLRFRVEGRQGHAAVQSSDANAIVVASRLVEVLDGALADWSAPEDTSYGRPSLNVGRIEGGEDIFTVAQRCEIKCGVRYAPGTYQSVLGHIESHLLKEGPQHRLPMGDLLNMTTFAHHDAAETPPDSPLATTLLSCVHQVAPDRRLVTCPGGTDARHFINRYGVPAVIFGPGQLTVAHAVDEFLPVEQWLKAIQALALFIVRWCG
ncbi:MAG: M20 family metallopeptidase [Anaerolineae bacterium]|nr:M20 family metallopeptidase [Anaerolineae bacterium]